MDLFSEHGFDDVTVEQIATRAGLTARTFYRYFGDKQEVLFFGSDGTEERLAQAVSNVAGTLSPLAAVGHALGEVARLIGSDHEHSVRRRRIIVAHQDLQERELTKLAGWSRRLSAALQANGVDQLTAQLAAETGIVVFRIAFEQWTAGPSAHEFDELLAQSFRELRGLAAAD